MRRHPADRLLERGRRTQQGRDVLEHDPQLGKVGDVANECFQIERAVGHSEISSGDQYRAIAGGWLWTTWGTFPTCQAKGTLETCPTLRRRQLLIQAIPQRLPGAEH